MKPARGFALIIIIAIILLVFVVSVFIIRNMFGVRILPVKMPVISESSKPTPSTDVIVDDETANWKTYTDRTVGLTFKYPESWRFEPSDQNRLITTRSTIKKSTGDFTPGYASILLDVKALPEEDILKNIIGVTKNEQITVDGVLSNKLSGAEGIAGSVQFVSVVVQAKNNYIYTFTFSTQDADMFNEINDEFNKILSTVKFVPIAI